MKITFTTTHRPKTSPPSTPQQGRKLHRRRPRKTTNLPSSYCPNLFLHGKRQPPTRTPRECPTKHCPAGPRDNATRVLSLSYPTVEWGARRGRTSDIGPQSDRWKAAIGRPWRHAPVRPTYVACPTAHTVAGLHGVPVIYPVFFGWPRQRKMFAGECWRNEECSYRTPDVRIGE